MKETLMSLLRSRKFLLAVVGVVQTLIFQFFPQFPDSVWVSINALLIVVITTIAFEDSAEKSKPEINYNWIEGEYKSTKTEEIE